jgi:hypothetical protein
MQATGYAGGHDSVISRMENHATDIRLSTFEKFAKAVGRHIDC